MLRQLAEIPYYFQYVSKILDFCVFHTRPKQPPAKKECINKP